MVQLSKSELSHGYARPLKIIIALLVLPDCRAWVELPADHAQAWLTNTPFGTDVLARTQSIGDIHAPPQFRHDSLRFRKDLLVHAPEASRKWRFSVL